MTFTLDSIVPWGRSFHEYERMFALTGRDLGGRILGCADGPASFNAEATRRGTDVVSCDPLYRFTRAEIRQQIDATYPNMMKQVRQNAYDFAWTEFASPEDVGHARMAAMDDFLDDYEIGLRQSRYVAAKLPSLPFHDTTFDLALCSHFLFLYTEQLSEDFHFQAIGELVRVAREVRIFPLFALDGAQSRHLETVSSRLKESHLSVTIEQVSYEFVKGAHEMMRVYSTSGL